MLFNFLKIAVDVRVSFFNVSRDDKAEDESAVYFLTRAQQGKLSWKKNAKLNASSEKLRRIFWIIRSSEN